MKKSEAKGIEIKMKEQKIRIRVLLLLVTAQFLGIAYINFTRSYGFVDFDASFAIRHAVEMWRDGIFLRDFSYSTSMEIDCAAFFAAPIYLLTNNLNLAMGIVHCLLNALVIYLVYVVFDQSFPDGCEGKTEATLLAVLLVFTPYSSKPGYLDWSNMLFICAGQYGFRVITMLSLVGVMLMSENEKTSRRKFMINLVLCLVLLFWTSLSAGIYVIGYILLPFLLKRGLDIIKKQEIEWKSRSNFCLLLFCVLWFLAMLLRSHNGVMSHRSNLLLIVARHFWDNILSMITGIFLLFGGLDRLDGMYLISENGIASMLRFGLVCFCVGLVIWEARRTKNHSSLFLTFCMMALVNLGVLAVTNSTYGQAVYEHRYHIQWTYLLLIVAAYILARKEDWPNRYAYRLAVWGTILVVTAINITGFSDMSEVEKDKGSVRRILGYADLAGADSIIVYGDAALAGSLRAMDVDKNSVSLMRYSDGSWVADVGYYSYTAAEHCYTEGSNLLICKTADFDALPPYIQSAYTLVVEDIDGMGNIYHALYSPWDCLSGLPLVSVDKAVDFPYSNGYVYQGVINEKGQLLAASAETECVLHGPYVNAVPGVYDITLYYHITAEGEKPAFFDVCSNGGEQVLKIGTLSPEAESVTLENVSVDGNALMEFRIWQYAGGEILVDKIVFERVGK